MAEWLGGTVRELTFPFEAPSTGLHLPKAARRWTANTLNGLDPDFVDTVALLVSELVTNAIRHGLYGDITVKILERFGSLHCRVANNVDATRPRLRRVGEASESGRGLAILEAEADRWGWLPEHPGRIWVMFEIGIPKVLPDSYRFPPFSDTPPP